MSVAATRTLVLGLGATGLSVVRFLHARGEVVAVADTREQPPGLEVLRREMPDVAVFPGGITPAVLAHADRVVVSPGLPSDTPVLREARARGLPVYGDIELFARYVDAPVAAVTGSNGKSTVTTLVGLMSRELPQVTRTGGNLGTPALELLGMAGETPALYVLELSSFQLELTESLATRVSTVLNVSPDHMDRYAGLAEYAAAKRRILAHAQTAVLNREDETVMAMASDVGRVVTFGLDRPPGTHDYGLLEHDGEIWLARGETPLMAAGELLIPGRHNQANALAALATGEAAGFAAEPMLRVLRTFPGLPHRSQWVAHIAGVDFYNDSKATNPGASLAAIRGLERPLVLIAGGDGKDADFSVLAPAVREHVRAAVLIGRDAELLETALAGCTELHRAGSLGAAVRLAARLAQAGDAVLLSPACASFDMFDGYEHRGRDYVAAVRELERQ